MVTERVAIWDFFDGKLCFFVLCYAEYLTNLKKLHIF